MAVATFVYIAPLSKTVSSSEVIAATLSLAVRPWSKATVIVSPALMWWRSANSEPTDIAFFPYAAESCPEVMSRRRSSA